MISAFAVDAPNILFQLLSGDCDGIVQVLLIFFEIVQRESADLTFHYSASESFSL